MQGIWYLGAKKIGLVPISLLFAWFVSVSCLNALCRVGFGIIAGAWFTFGSTSGLAPFLSTWSLYPEIASAKIRKILRTSLQLK